MRVVILHMPPPWREAPAASLAAALAVPLISFGNLMRAHLSQGTPLGRQAAEIMNSGRLLPDETITAIIRDHLQQATPASFILDGHPRSTAQALALDELLSELNKPLDAVLWLRFPEEERDCRIRHQAARRVCRNDPSHRYAPEVDPPVVDDLCPVCGGELYQRADDNENTIRGRFNSSEATMTLVTEYYARQDRLVTVDAESTSGETTSRAIAALRQIGS